MHGLLAMILLIPREQQDIALPLMISLSMEMFDIFAQCSPQGALSKEDHLGQTLERSKKLKRPTRRSVIHGQYGGAADGPVQFLGDQ